MSKPAIKAIPARDGRRLGDADWKPGDVVQNALHGPCRVLGWGAVNFGGQIHAVLRAEPVNKPGEVVHLRTSKWRGK